jgi:hypothetical protein
MTMRYAHLSPNVTREIVGLLDSVGSITGTETVPGSQRAVLLSFSVEAPGIEDAPGVGPKAIVH